MYSWSPYTINTENYSKHIEKFGCAFSRIWTEYGAKKPVFTVVLCSVMEQNISI